MDRYRNRLLLTHDMGLSFLCGFDRLLLHGPENWFQEAPIFWRTPHGPTRLLLEENRNTEQVSPFRSFIHSSDTSRPWNSEDRFWARSGSVFAPAIALRTCSR